MLYLTSATFELVTGNLEINLDGGEVRPKASIDVECVESNKVLVDHILLAGIVTTDRYLPGLIAVIGGQSGCVH
jgi:hypothetical protein